MTKEQMQRHLADMQALAQDIAREMHEEHFDSHRGSGVVEGQGLLYLYDNHPYADDSQRPREHAEIHALLATKGAMLVASGRWPLDGEDAGYTVAHVYACDDDATAEAGECALRDRYEHIVRRTVEAPHN